MDQEIIRNKLILIKELEDKIVEKIQECQQDENKIKMFLKQFYLKKFLNYI
jgi:hypothetical protein